MPVKSFYWATKRKGIAFHVAAIGMLLLMFLFSYQGLDHSQYPWFLAFSIILFTGNSLVIISIFRQKAIYITQIGILYAFLWFGLVFLSVYSAKWATNPSESIYQSLKFLAFLNLFIILLYLFGISDTYREWAVYYWLFVILIAIGTIAGEFVIQIVSTGKASPHKAMGFLTNKNNMAGLLVLCNAPIVILYFKINTKWQFFTLSILLILIWSVLVIYFARSALLAFGISVGVVFLANYRKAIVYFKRYGFIALSIAIGGIAAIIYFVKQDKTYMQSKLNASLETTTHQDTMYGDIENSLKVRWHLWQSSLQMIKDNPLKGAGAGNWRLQFPRYGIQKLGYEVKQGNKIYQRPHNDYLQQFAEIGIPGGLLYLSLLLIPVIVSLVSVGPKNNQKIAFQLFFLTFFIWAGVEYPAERLIFFVLFMLFAAMLFSLQSFASIKMNKILLIAVFVLLMAGSGLSIVFFSQKVAGENIVKEVQQLPDEGWGQQYDLSDGALHRLDVYSTPIAWYFGNYYFNRKNYKKAEIYYLRAYQLNPCHLNVLHNLASCLEKNGRTQKAVFFYKKVLHFSSSHNHSLLNLSKIFFNQGKFHKARKKLKKVEWQWNETPPGDYKKLKTALEGIQNK